MVIHIILHLNSIKDSQVPVISYTMLILLLCQIKTILLLYTISKGIFWAKHHNSVPNECAQRAMLVQWPPITRSFASLEEPRHCMFCRLLFALGFCIVHLDYIMTFTCILYVMFIGFQELFLPHYEYCLHWLCMGM